MKARAGKVVRALVVGTLALALLGWAHELLARRLASLGLLEQLLCPSADALVALVAALGLYTLRAILFVFGPALLISSIFRAADNAPRAADSSRPCA